jgi:heterotetrameric sarcosine oxidase gamma subunit
VDDATVDDTTVPVARSPIRPVGGAAVVEGWERPTSNLQGSLRLCDLSNLAKVHIRASPPAPVAHCLGTAAGSAVRDAAGRLMVGSGPGEWLVIGPQGHGEALTEELGGALANVDAFVSVVDLTHGRALMRLSGAQAISGVLAKQCAIDFSDRLVPNGAAIRTSVASLVTDIVRDDVGDERSYLLHCERSSGQYLFDVLLDAGRDHGIVR